MPHSTLLICCKGFSLLPPGLEHTKGSGSGGAWSGGGCRRAADVSRTGLPGCRGAQERGQRQIWHVPARHRRL